jgi:spermidine synthase
MMLKIASDEKLFTYYADCKATHKVIIGDGRQALAHARDGEYDMITFDAFSSDAIPVHLLTREALQLYLSKLAPGGVLVFHISSRTVDLKPTLRELAKDANLTCLLEVSGTNAKWSKEHKLSSTWMVMARSENDLALLREKSAFAPPDPNQKASLWTDDFSNLLETLRLN